MEQVKVLYSWAKGHPRLAKYFNNLINGWPNHRVSVKTPVYKLHNITGAERLRRTRGEDQFLLK